MATRLKLTNVDPKTLYLHRLPAMKIVAISHRGRKRDFIDLYWYCVHREPLADVIRRALLQFPGQKDNIPHILKSLSYFEDAEQDPMPKLFFDAGWKKVKAYFYTEAIRMVQKEIF